MAHSRRATVRGSRSLSVDTAACSSSHRTRVWPALVIRPRRRLSPSLSFRGTSPHRPPPGGLREMVGPQHPRLRERSRVSPVGPHSAAAPCVTSARSSARHLRRRLSAGGRFPSTSPNRPVSVRARRSISSPSSVRMQIWLSFLWTSVSIWSWLSWRRW